MVLLAILLVNAKRILNILTLFVTYLSSSRNKRSHELRINGSEKAYENQ